MEKTDSQFWNSFMVVKGFLQFQKFKGFCELYIFDQHPEKPLSPLLAPRSLTIISNGIWILGGVLLLFWPQKSLYEYVFNHETPVNYLIIYGIILTISGYINLKCGRGEMLPGDFISRLQKPAVTWEESNDFLTYGFIKFLLQIFIFIVPFFPLMLISAMLSQVPWSGIGGGFGVIFSFSLFCRILGFRTYLLWGSNDLRGHYLCRILLIVFIGLTFYFVTSINPFLQIFSFHQGREISNFLSGHWDYFIFITMVILLLTWSCHLSIKHKTLNVS